MKNIRNISKILVEQILSEKYVDANNTLTKLIAEAEEIRENEISAELGDEMTDQVDETEETTDSSETDEIDEPTDGDPNLGDDLDDDLGSGEDEDAQVGNGQLSEMSNDIVEINCEINQKIIDKLYDKVSNLKSQINSLNLDKNEREYISLETKLSYYGNKLDELQTKTNPAIDQSKVEERLEIISNALKALEAEILGGDSENMGEDVETSEELDSTEGASGAEGSQENVS
jgi:hypothetical protein